MQGINLMLDWYTPIWHPRWFFSFGAGAEEHAASIQIRILGFGFALTFISNAKEFR